MEAWNGSGKIPWAASGLSAATFALKAEATVHVDRDILLTPTALMD